MKQNKRILQDISKIASSAFSSAAGVKRDITSYIHSQMEEFLRGMNFVRREEFEALHKLALDNKKRLDEISPKPAVKVKDVVAPKKKSVATKEVAAAKVSKKPSPVKNNKTSTR